MLQATEAMTGPVMGRNIAVIGSGYVGLALSASLALLGHQVECTDKSPERIAQLSAGVVPVVEDSLTEVIGEMLSADRIRFGTDNARAAAKADFVFLCLPTPADAGGQPTSPSSWRSRPRSDRTSGRERQWSPSPPSR